MRSGGSSREGFAVYDFDDAEGEVEAASGEYMKRFAPPKPSGMAEEKKLDKNAFFRAFCPKVNSLQRDISDVRPDDSLEKVNDVDLCVADTFGRNPMLTEVPSMSEDLVVTMTNHKFISPNEPIGDVDSDPLVIGASALLSFGGVKDLPNMPSMVKTDSVMTDSDEDLSSTSESPSPFAQHEGSLELEQDYLNSHHVFQENSYHEVIVIADYVSCGDTIFGEARLIFYTDRVKFELLDEGDSEKIEFEVVLTDLVRIVCCLSENVEVILVNIFIKPSAASKMKRIIEASVTGGLEAAISRFYWIDQENKIRSLASIYREILDVLEPSCFDWENDLIKKSINSSLDHLKEIVEPFDDVIYPKGDPDAVSISGRDIELLQPDTFINDTIIDFYIKYLKNRMPSPQKHRFHFFNSFFFRKLADLDKNPGCSSEGRAAFLRVRKWTRKVDLFQKDYVFIPVNFNLHWSLLVICHPGELILLNDVTSEESPKLPCILHMDSIKGCHSGLKSIIQSYLCEEWKEKHTDSTDADSTKFSEMRFVSLEVPQQNNSFDCGLFLLHFVELFLKEAPFNFNPFIPTKHSHFLNSDWFLPAEASQKRSSIRKLIYGLLKDSSIPYTSGDGPPCELTGKDEEYNCKQKEERSDVFRRFPCDIEVQIGSSMTLDSLADAGPIVATLGLPHGNNAIIDNISGASHGDHVALEQNVGHNEGSDVGLVLATLDSLEGNDTIKANTLGGSLGDHVALEQSEAQNEGSGNHTSTSICTGLYVPESPISSPSARPECSVVDPNIVDATAVSISDINGGTSTRGADKPPVKSGDFENFELNLGSMDSKGFEGTDAMELKDGDRERHLDLHEYAEVGVEERPTITVNAGDEACEAVDSQNSQQVEDPGGCYVVDEECRLSGSCHEESSSDRDETGATKRMADAVKSEKKVCKRQKLSMPAAEVIRRRTRASTRNHAP